MNIIKQYKTMIAGVLLFALIMSALAGCGKSGENAKPETDASAGQKTETVSGEENGKESSEENASDSSADPDSGDDNANNNADDSSSGSADQDGSAAGKTDAVDQSQNEDVTADSAEAGEQAEGAMPEDIENAPELPGMTCIGRLAPEYAVTFDAFYYEGGYQLVDIFDEARYLLIPENGEVPEGLPEDIICLQKPFERIYMAATAVYSHFHALAAMDRIRFTSTQKGSIYLKEVDEGLENGTMLFAGKYNTPDYETLLEGECDLAIENTGIHHVPEVQEMIEDLQIPVWIDRSSYESHPLGRTEWIRLYGLLTDKEEEAEFFFEEQKKKLEETTAHEPTGKKVVFFYMTGDGIPVIRQPDDYIVKMIEMAGGEYAFAGYKLASDSVAPRISMEEFYSMGKDADVLIYNATMESPLASIDELLGMSELFKDFKAVQNGTVWSANESLFQRADICAEFTGDISAILRGDEDAPLQFLKKVEPLNE